MTKKRILPVCFHALLLSIFFAVVQPANIYAGEKDITIPFTKNYDNVTLTIMNGVKRGVHWCFNGARRNHL